MYYVLFDLEHLRQNYILDFNFQLLIMMIIVNYFYQILYKLHKKQVIPHQCCWGQKEVVCQLYQAKFFLHPFFHFNPSFQIITISIESEKAL